MNQRLFLPDPIDFFDPAPYSFIEYQGHMIVGSIWFIAALIAFASAKGKWLHVRAGQVCIVGVLLIAATAFAMFTVDLIPPLALNAVTGLYAVLGGWLALKPATSGVRTAEKALTGVEAAALAAFLAYAVPNVLDGSAPPIGPGIIAAVPVILLAGDLNWHMRPSDRARLRVRRHLARMVWAFATVVRPAIVEFETAGFYDLPDPLLVVGPLLLGAALVAWFQLRYGRRAVRTAAQPA